MIAFRRSNPWSIDPWSIHGQRCQPREPAGARTSTLSLHRCTRRSTTHMPAEIHVATTGSDTPTAPPINPFRTINEAAALAQPGDTVIVHAGEYREWVRPRRGGLSDQRRITYKAAPGEHVVDQGLRAGDRLGAGRRQRLEGAVPNVAVRRRSTRSPRRSTATGSSTPTALAEEAPRRRLPERHSFYEVLTLEEVSDPPLRTEVARRLDRDDRPHPQPRADAATSGTPRSAPTRRRSGRTSRARTRTTSSSRSTSAARSSTRPSTTSTTSPSAASSWPRPPPPGPRRPPTSRA